MNVLFFSAWYPHRYDAMAGLFVRKHAEAVSRHARVCVLFPFEDEHVCNFEVVKKTFNEVTEIYVYYPYCKNPLLKTLSKGINYFRAFFKGYKVVLAQFGKPDICHANVLTRSGFLAYYLKKRYAIPYVVMEHWTRYLPENFSYTGFFRKQLSECVVREAGCIMPVSADLMRAMVSCGLKSNNYQVVNNVVDDFFYIPQESVVRHKKRILHISCFDEKHKNVFGILRVIKKIAEQRNDFELIIVGTGVDFQMTYDYAQSLNLPVGVVKFVGEQAPQEVCQWFYNSDFFLLFSNYENAPVVISESLAVGKPVLSSNVGGIAEMVRSQTGVLIEKGEEQALFEQTNLMLDHFQEFDATKIREAGHQYSYDAVGENLMAIYRATLQGTPSCSPLK
ncbi:MAG TPA: glycosyltransferase [Paludibacteraceae bacterium]|nr:glycosyltransferase [Paludibacteraceae bacterium]